MEVDPKLKSAVIKLKSGNDEDFGIIYERTYNYVYFRARQLMKNEDDALDLLQIVYMEAYKSIGSLDKVESIYSWLSSITFRQGMKLFHKNKEILLDEDFESIFDSMESNDPDSQPTLSLERKEEQRLLAELIDSLPEVQRATVVAFYYDNIKIEEIAEVMDCSVGTVKSRLSYARQALKKKLEKAGKGGNAGKMALTGALIFGAVQVMSEETVLAAPIAASSFGSICSGLGITGAGLALAGSPVAGGAGISAATGSTLGATAGTAAAGTAAAGTAVAGTAAAGAAAAGTAAAGTAAAGTAAAGTAAAGTVAAGTAAAGTAAAGTAAAGAAAAGGAAVSTAAGTVAVGGAAKGIAVAVAVAVAGTGGTVGTTIYRKSVSEAKKVSENEEISGIDETVSENSELITVEEEPIEEVVPAVPEEIPEDEEILTPEEDNTEALSEDAVPEAAPEEVSENKAASTEESVSGDELKTVKYDLSKKTEKHIASAVATLFYAGNCSPVNGEINDDMLEAAYILERGNILSKKQIKAVSANKLFLRNPEVTSAVRVNDDVVINGRFDAAKTDELGNICYDTYSFVLSGKEFAEKGAFGRFHSLGVNIALESGGNVISSGRVSGNEAVSSNKTEKTRENPVLPADPVNENEEADPEVQKEAGTENQEYYLEPARSTVSDIEI